MSLIKSHLLIQQITADVLKEKYAKDDELDEDAIFARVAKGLAAAEELSKRASIEQLFLKNMKSGAIGAGRIMSAAGTDIKSTLINCFVQPVGDCILGLDDEGFPGIYEALKEAAETMRRGGGVGYDFSRIRPRGAFVRQTASIASGPCSYINVFDQSCSTVESAGSRRGAQMGVLRINHPDILEFITAKRTPGRWNNFNVSVAVTDTFMQAIENDSALELIHIAKPGEEILGSGAYQRNDGLWVYRKIQAREIWDIVMKSAYDFAEPGILFIDNINKDNNLSYCENITATNPCGEQPLPPYGCCDLGPIILTKFVLNPFGINGEASFDYKKFTQAVKIQVRMLDNVLDVTYWPLEQQEKEAKAKRRIGIGFTGLGDTLIMLKLKYNSIEAREEAKKITKEMRDSAYSGSIELAKEKGAFPLFDAEKYINSSTFIGRLSEELKRDIRRYGIRNSHLLSIAPTGTVSLAFADNASNGIEPPFSWFYTRKKREADGQTLEYSVEDHAWRLYKNLGGNIEKLPDYFVSALEMSANDHLEMMEAIQPYIDTAISKTVNIATDYPYQEFKKLYKQAWNKKLKGLATYRPNNILGSVLELTSNKEVSSDDCSESQEKYDPKRVVIESRPKGILPALAEKVEYWTQEGVKTLYLIVSFMSIPTQNGKVVERAVEFFMPVGQSGESQQWITSSMRMLSLAARGGFLDRALSDMRKVVWDRGSVRLGKYEKSDGTKVPLWHDSEVAAIAYAIQCMIEKQNHVTSGNTIDIESSNEDRSEKFSSLMHGKKCVECGANAVIRKDGCDYCTQCGHIGSCG